MEAVRLQTIKAVKAGQFEKKQDDDSRISTKATASTSSRALPRRGPHSQRPKKRTTTNRKRKPSLSSLTRNIFVRIE